MERHHFAAHVVFADLAGFVISVTRTRPLRRFVGYYSKLDLPIEKSLSSITVPQCAVAVKSRELGMRMHHCFDELIGFVRWGFGQNLFPSWDGSLSWFHFSGSSPLSSLPRSLAATRKPT